MQQSSTIPKKQDWLISSTFVCVKAFPMYGGIGVSAPSLHRESTDSLIVEITYIQRLGFLQLWHVSLLSLLHSNVCEMLMSITRDGLITQHPI